MEKEKEDGRKKGQKVTEGGERVQRVGGGGCEEEIQRGRQRKIQKDTDEQTSRIISIIMSLLVFLLRIRLFVIEGISSNYLI